MEAERIDRLGMRNRIGRKHPNAEIRAGTHRYIRRVDGEAALAAPVLSTRDIVSAHIARERDILIGGCSDERRTERQSPHLRRAKVLDDLRARVAGAAAVENAFRRQSTDRIRPVAPPLRSFCSRFIKFPRAVWHREPCIQRHTLTGNDRPRAIVDFAVAFVLREAKVNHGAKVVARLRTATADDPAHLTSHRVRRAFDILYLIFEERSNMPEGCETDAEHIRVLRREYDLIQQLWIEAALYADLGWIRRARKWIRGAAFRPRPIGGGNRWPFGNFSIHRLRTMRGEFRFRCIQGHRLVGYGVGIDD